MCRPKRRATCKKRIASKHAPLAGCTGPGKGVVGGWTLVRHNVAPALSAGEVWERRSPGVGVGTAVAGRLAAISRKSSRRRMSNELEFRRRYKTTSSSRRSSQARLWRPRPTGCRSTVDAHGLLGATSPLATPAHDAVAAALRASTALRGETAASPSHRGSHPPACPQHTAAAVCPLGKSCTAQPFRRGGASQSSRRTLAARSSSVATGAVASRQGRA